VKDAFDTMLREFRGTRPVEEVPFGANPKTGLSGHRKLDRQKNRKPSEN
jgi:hypothetical protein